MGKATGIIEVYGLAAAFVAVDAGCKAASVTVSRKGASDSIPYFKELS